MRFEVRTTTVAEQTAAATARLRTLDLQKRPGVAETVDWAAALAALGADRLSAEAAEASLGSVLKYREDQSLVRDQGLAWVVGE